MDKQPLVSIILPTYNGSRYIRQSIDSCLGQTYKNLELIIVDDCSSDGTADIVKSYFDPRIKYVKHEKNLKLPWALNTGFKNAKGDYLTWTSDDNFYAPEAIATMVLVLEEKQEVGFIYTNYYIVDEAGKIIGRQKVPSPKIVERYNCVGACFLYRRIVYKQVGEYDPDFYFAEDYEYWLRIKSQFKLHKLNQFLYYYRHHKDSLTFQHKIAEIEEQTGRASSKYIFLPSIKYYHQGKLFFYKKNYGGASKELIKSLFHEPLNLDTWKLLIFVYLTILVPDLAQKIKKIRD